MELTELFLYIFLFLLGWVCREIRAYLWLRKNSLVEEQQENDNRIAITIDIKDDIIFVYEKDTLTYLAHGENRKAIEKMLTERFPNKLFAASEQDIMKLIK